jgi:hypothetical protein
MVYTQQPYFARDDRWEYKVVQAPNGEFGQREHLRLLLRQEGRAGWVMVEKYDDWRVLFKRPRSAAWWDDHLPPEVDPYRSVYTVSYDSDWIYALALAGGVLYVIVALVILVVLVSWP